MSMISCMRQHLQNRRLLWFAHQDGIKLSSWYSHKFQVSGSLARGLPRKTWVKVIERNLKEQEVRK